MRKTRCPHCRKKVFIPIPPDAPTAAQVAFLCANCRQSFLYTVGEDDFLVLLLARVRLWVQTLPFLVKAFMWLCIYWAAVNVGFLWGYPPLLAVLVFTVFCASCRRWQAVRDLNYLLFLVASTMTVAGTLTLTYPDEQLKAMAFAVLLVLVMAWFFAPGVQWYPPAQINFQQGIGHKATDFDIDRAGL